MFSLVADYGDSEESSVSSDSSSSSDDGAGKKESNHPQTDETLQKQSSDL